MAGQNFCARYFALSWKLLTGELSTQLRWLSRITASTSTARACAIRLSRSILPVPSSMLSVFRIGVMALPERRVPRSLMCYSFMREPSRCIHAKAFAPPSVNQ